MPGSGSPEECASLVMEVVPSVMRAIRGEMRRLGTQELTVPQLRTLLFVTRRDGSSLSDVAEHIGLSLPSASRLVDLLVERGLLRRRTSSADRRRIVLAATPRGQSLMESVRAGVQTKVARRLADLPPDVRVALVRGLEGLQLAFLSKRVAVARRR